jgi:hypothetical protein
MADKVSVEQIADTMYNLVVEYTGKRKFKAQDLVREATMKYGEENVSRADGKAALKLLIDKGRCVYTYFGGSFVELPPKES